MKENIINQFKQSYFKANIEKTNEYLNNAELIAYLKSKKEPVHYLFLTEHSQLLKLALDKIKWNKNEFEATFGFNNIYDMFFKQDRLDNFTVLNDFYKTSPKILHGYPIILSALKEKAYKISTYLFNNMSTYEMVQMENEYFNLYDSLSQSFLKEELKKRILHDKVPLSIPRLFALSIEPNEDMEYLNQYLLNNPNLDKDYKHQVFSQMVNQKKFHLLNQIDKQLVVESFHGLKLTQSFKSYKHLKFIDELKKFIKDNPNVAHFTDSFFLYDKDDTNLFFQLFKKSTNKITIEHKLDFIRQVLADHLDNVDEMIYIIDKCNKIRNNFVDEQVYKRLFTEYLILGNNTSHLVQSIKLLKHFTDTLKPEFKKEFMHTLFDKIFEMYPIKMSKHTNIKQKEYKAKILELLVNTYPELIKFNSKNDNKPYVLHALKDLSLFKIVLLYNPELETPSLSKNKVLNILNQHNNTEFKISYEKALLEHNLLVSNDSEKERVSSERKKFKI